MPFGAVAGLAEVADVAEVVDVDEVADEVTDSVVPESPADVGAEPSAAARISTVPTSLPLVSFSTPETTGALTGAALSVVVVVVVVLVSVDAPVVLVVAAAGSLVPDEQAASRPAAASADRASRGREVREVRGIDGSLVGSGVARMPPP